MGLTKSTTNKLNETNEAILQDKPKQVPTSPTRASGSFNTTNNALDDYQTSCTDRWEHTKAPLLSKRRYQGRHWEIFLAHLHYIIFPREFLNIDFGIKDVVTGTTPVATLRKLTCHFCNPDGDILAPSERTQLDWRICTSSRPIKKRRRTDWAIRPIQTHA